VLKVAVRKTVKKVAKKTARKSKGKWSLFTKSKPWKVGWKDDVSDRDQKIFMKESAAYRKKQIKDAIAAKKKLR
jgi:hypothetical protein